ncbi:MAG: macro domain-containing protein [Desulfovibrionaceae bacterium]
MTTAYVWPIARGALHLAQGDLTRSAADAIVNAANNRLAGGGGVDGAIHRAAGPHLLAACQDWVAAHGPLPTGQAMLTPGFSLAARHVIHTVGPIWRGGGAGEEALLTSAYTRSLELAQAHALAWVAFPAISCGVYGYPLELAVPVALAALRRGLEAGLARRVDMCLHDGSALAAWAEVARALFGPPTA